jgi:hypothetical protein
VASFLVLNIEEHGIRDLQGRFAKFTEESAKIQRDSLRNLGHEYVRILREEAPIDTGNLREGITFKTYEINKGHELHITSKMGYTPFVLRGTGPHSAPISALQGWADRHGINVWAVWQSIKKKGTSVWSEQKYGDRANKFQMRASERMEPVFDNEVSRMSAEIRDYIVGI